MSLNGGNVLDKQVYKEAIFNRKEFKEQLDYWLGILEGHPVPMDLPMDFKEQEEEGKVYDTIHMKLPPHLPQKILQLSKYSDITLYVVLLTIFKAFLFRYTRNEEIMIVSIREKTNHGDIISGLFLEIRWTPI
jgi:hypothetical protein